MFPTTNWTRLEGRRAHTAGRREELGALARAYRQPLLVLARRRGLAPAEAEDVVQELFARLVARDALRDLERARGRLRGFLACALDRAVAHHRERAHARKRGGGIAPVALDDVAVPAEPVEPAFDRAWRAVVFERAFARLAVELPAAGLAVVECCFRTDDAPALAALAEVHGTTVPALKSLLHRARARFRGLVRDEVAATLAPGADLDAELRALAL